MKVELIVTERGQPNNKFTINSDINGEASFQELAEFYKRATIAVALNVLEEEQFRGRFPTKDFQTIVDNKIGKSVLDVKPFGRISFLRKIAVNQIILEAYDAVVSRSPVDTGTYERAHQVMLGKKVIATTRGELVSWINSTPELKEGQTIRIVNLVPYAGKLERLGVSKGRKKPKWRKSTDPKRRSGPVVRATNGTYYLASRAISKKYKFSTPIRFEFVPAQFLDMSRAPVAGPRGTFRRTFIEPKNSKKKPRGSYVYPSILIRLKAGGLV